MKLSSVEESRSFALLGPGFGSGFGLDKGGDGGGGEDKGESSSEGRGKNDCLWLDGLSLLSERAHTGPRPSNKRAAERDPDSETQHAGTSRRTREQPPLGEPEPEAERLVTSPELWFAPYETPGAAARCYLADRVERGPLELDVAAAAAAVVPALAEQAFAEGVEEIRAAIAAGDVYQVNLTTRVELAAVSGSTLGAVSGSTLAALLCRRGVPRFFAWVRLPDGHEFVSASPELLFAYARRRIRVEPMKGTAAAGHEEALAASNKDRAELAMITDLMRNELTPICEPGSVQVVNPRRVIRLPYAVQTVSDIEGELLPGIGPRAVLAALHPGGSVTGAPKAAAMRIIGALETTPRGPYCGTLGLCRGEHATFSLLIRTAARTATAWTFGVGGGIVWDSSAALELEELRIKLGALR